MLLAVLRRHGNVTDREISSAIARRMELMYIDRVKAVGQVEPHGLTAVASCVGG